MPEVEGEGDDGAVLHAVFGVEVLDRAGVGRRQRVGVGMEWGKERRVGLRRAVGTFTYDVGVFGDEGEGVPVIFGEVSNGGVEEGECGGAGGVVGCGEVDVAADTEEGMGFCAGHNLS